jgi:hypothetical protein
MDASSDDELNEAIAVVKQKMDCYRCRFEPVPISFQIELDRLIERKRVAGDPNF